MVPGASKSFHVSSPLHGELSAIREASLMMEALGLKGMEIESDNKEAIHLSVSERICFGSGYSSFGPFQSADFQLGSLLGQQGRSYGCGFSYERQPPL